MKFPGWDQVGAFVDGYFTRKYSRLLHPFFQGTITSVSAVNGADGNVASYECTVQRTGESSSDGHTYSVNTPGYVPVSGDQVECMWRVEGEKTSTGYVLWPLNRSGSGTAAFTPLTPQVVYVKGTLDILGGGGIPDATATELTASGGTGVGFGIPFGASPLIIFPTTWLLFNATNGSGSPEVVLAGGRFRFEVSIRLGAIAGAAAFIDLWGTRNGNRFDLVSAYAPVGSSPTLAASVTETFALGDVIRLFVKQTSGSPQSLAATGSPVFADNIQPGTNRFRVQSAYADWAVTNGVYNNPNVDT